MTTGGEGGMVTTDDRDAVVARCGRYKDHGKSLRGRLRARHPPGFRWVHESFGTNWRMTEMQAAIGRIQLRRMPAWSAAPRRQCCAPGSGLQQACGRARAAVPAHIRHANYASTSSSSRSSSTPGGRATGSSKKSRRGAFPACRAPAPRSTWRRPSTAPACGRRTPAGGAGARRDEPRFPGASDAQRGGDRVDVQCAGRRPDAGSARGSASGSGVILTPFTERCPPALPGATAPHMSQK